MLSYSTKRIKCPECGARRGFAPIQGELGAGKCFACGLFKPPKNANNGHSEPFKNEPQNDKYISEFQVMASQADLKKNNFAAGLIELGIPIYHLQRWDIGNGKNGTVFFYRNIHGKYINAKVIVYKDDLHRDKNIPPRFMFSKAQGYKQCLFGEWQLQGAKLNQPILLVESEKTAIVGSFAMLNKIWIATGGATGLTKEKALILKNRSVYIVVDSDEAGRNSAIKTENILKEICRNVKIIDLFHDKKTGQDIADYLVARLKAIKSKIKTMPDKIREQFEERAAIMEYCAGLSRYEAELQTLNNMESV